MNLGSFEREARKRRAPAGPQARIVRRYTTLLHGQVVEVKVYATPGIEDADQRECFQPTRRGAFYPDWSLVGLPRAIGK